MAAPQSLLQGARAFARDFPRDQMPQGYLWDVADYVPIVIDAPLTGRGGWLWGSTAMGADGESGLLATFSNGDQLMVQATNGQLYTVGLNTPFTATAQGAVPRSLQNPIQMVDQVFHFDQTQTLNPRVITAPTASTLAIGGLQASHKKAKFGVIYKSLLVTANAPGEIDTVRFSVAGKNLVTDPLSYDDVSLVRTSGQITAIAALRSAILVFHAGSVERIRGSTPPYGSSTGDMFLERLFDRAGCIDPKAIAYWNDNCVFADEHGVHITDGAVIRNLISQGGLLTYWRMLYTTKLSLSACTFLDYYLITIQATDGSASTLICDLNKRQWFRFTNIGALFYGASGGTLGMERIWAAKKGTNRLIRIGPCFFPALGVSTLADDDGTVVLPSLETAWYRMGEDGRKRVKNVYLEYDARMVSPPAGDLAHQPSLLNVGYMLSPQDASYTSLGGMPPTDRLRRYRLPVGKFPYGIAFRVQQTAATTVTRIYNLAAEEWAADRSRT